MAIGVSDDCIIGSGVKSRLSPHHQKRSSRRVGDSVGVGQLKGTPSKGAYSAVPDYNVRKILVNNLHGDHRTLSV